MPPVVRGWKSPETNSATMLVAVPPPAFCTVISKSRFWSGTISDVLAPNETTTSCGRANAVGAGVPVGSGVDVGPSTLSAVAAVALPPSGLTTRTVYVPAGMPAGISARSPAPSAVVTSAPKLSSTTCAPVCRPAAETRMLVLVALLMVPGWKVMLLGAVCATTVAAGANAKHRTAIICAIAHPRLRAVLVETRTRAKALNQEKIMVVTLAPLTPRDRPQGWSG